MKRSTVVTLSLIGLPFAVGAIVHKTTGHGPMQRNVYASREACERDYSPALCEEEAERSSVSDVGGSNSGPGGGHSGGYGRHWVGPLYASGVRGGSISGDPGPGRVGGLATRVASAGGSSFASTSSRGGFGGFASSASASTSSSSGG